MDGMKEKIGLWDCEGYCIGDMVHDGCQINQDKKSDDMVEVKIDFTKTDVDMCSLVIYLEKKDWHRWAESEKDISMNIEADNSILKMGLEIRISGRDYLYNLPNPEGTLKLLRTEKKCDEKEREIWKKQLLKDLRNYLYCVSCGLRFKFKMLRLVFQETAAEELEEPLAEIIEEYYRDNFEGKGDYDGKAALDYERLYIDIGDRILFLRQDWKLAMRYYGLADLDWFHLRDTSCPEEELDERRRSALVHWNSTYRFYQQMMNGRYYPEEIYCDLKIEQEMKSLFERLIVLWKNGQEYKEIVQCSDMFLALLYDVKNKEDEHVDTLRDMLVLAHIVRENGILPGLYCLSDETKRTQGKVRISALKCVSESWGKDTEILARYARDEAENQSLLEEILLLARSIIFVRNVKQALRVRKMNQDMAYYTALESFFYMLPVNVKKKDECGRLSIMNIAYMNDPNEGKILRRFLFEEKAEQQNAGERKSIRYPYVFMKCFTSLIDDLPMWEMYGDHAKGCCLVLDWEDSVRTTDNGEEVPLFRICYLKRKGTGFMLEAASNQDISDLRIIRKNLKALKRIAKGFEYRPYARETFMQILEEIVYLFKDSDYQHEREMRILYNFSERSEGFRHTGGEYPMLFVQPEFAVKIKEIIVGPKFDKIAERMPYIQEQVEEMCEATGAKIPKMTISDIDYK